MTLSIPTEILLIIVLVTAFYFIAKLLGNINIKGKSIIIPKVMLVIITGFIFGIIMRAINSDLTLQLPAYLSFISLTVLFLAFGTMIDFKKFKQFGIWTIVLGTIPMLVEVVFVTVIITLISKLLWFEAALPAILLATCAPGVTGGRIMANMKMGYEKQTSLNETINLAGSIENIFILVLFIIDLIIYQIHYGAGSISTGVAVAAPFLLLGFGLVLGLSLGLFIIYVLKPVARLIISPVAVSATGLEDEALDKANDLNKKRENKTNTLFFVMTFALLAAIYLALQLTIGLGFIMMESALIAGILISFIGSKSIDNQKAQFTLAIKSNGFYVVVGSLIVWGFGGMLIDPAQVFGAGWSVSAVPNLVWILVIIAASIVSRFIGTILGMSLNKEYSIKQKLYVAITNSTKGTGGVNNGATILILLGATTGTIQYGNALIIQSMLLAVGAVMIFITIPIGDMLLGSMQDKLIFRWDSKSEGQFKVAINKAMKEEGVSSSDKKEMERLIKEYWNGFYSLNNQTSKFESSKHKGIKPLEEKISYLSKSVSIVEANIYKLESFAQLKLASLSRNKDNAIEAAANDEVKIGKANSKFDNEVNSVNSKLEINKERLNLKLADLNNQLNEVKNELTSEQARVNSIELPEDASSTKEKLVNVSKMIDKKSKEIFKEKTNIELTNSMVKAQLA